MIMHTGEMLGTIKTTETTLPFAGGVADLAQREVRYHAGERCRLSELEAGLLRYLAAHADEPSRATSCSAKSGI